MPFGPTGDLPQGGTGTSGGGGGDAYGIGAAIATAGALYDSAQNRELSRENTNKGIAANRAAAELAYQRSVEMWNLQNAYNSPAAQMERFKAAGLNPHLIYGQGNSGNAGTPPAYQPPHYQYRYESGNFGAALGGLLPMLMSVGSWMQQMKASEVDIEAKRVGMRRSEMSMEEMAQAIAFARELQPGKVRGQELSAEKARQLMDYLSEANPLNLASKATDVQKTRQMIEFLSRLNPELLEQSSYKTDMMRYQGDIARANSSLAWTKVNEMAQKFRVEYGDELFSYLPQDPRANVRQLPITGTKGLDFLSKQIGIDVAKERKKLVGAQAELFEPATIVRMVSQAVGAMALTGLRRFAPLSPGSPPPTRGSINRKTRPIEDARDWNNRRRR